MAITLLEGTEQDFRKKTKKRWTLRRVRHGKNSAIYVFYTCPYCGGINQAKVSKRNYGGEECRGRFFCIGCKVCGRKEMDLTMSDMWRFYRRLDKG